MYKVIQTFADLQDKNYVYNAGDDYPREGSTPSKERIAELAGSKNKIGKALIQEVIPVEEPAPVVTEEEKPKPKKGRKKKTDEVEADSEE